MRKLFITTFLLAAFCLIPGTVVMAADRGDNDKSVASKVEKAFNELNFTLDITMIIPSQFPSEPTGGEYRLTMADGKVDTWLPFRGSSHMPVFGGDVISIVFENEAVEVKKDLSRKDKGEYLLSFRGGSGVQKWDVSITLYDNGNASIDCNGSGGGNMRFLAELSMDTKE